MGREIVFNSGFTSCATAERGCHINHDRLLLNHELYIRRDHVILDWSIDHIFSLLANNSKKATIYNNLFKDSDKMNIIVLTSSRYGTAAHHLPYLINSKSCEISMVILNEGIIFNKNKYYKSKIRKIIKIGLLGALNGIRMRKWFNQDIAEYKKIEELEEICRNNNIPFFTTPNINSQFTLDLFKKANADLGLSLGNGYIGQKIFSLPRYGMINIHHEILPAYQNAQSIIWQL